MQLTLDEIVEHKDRLRREIMEKKCLLAAFDVVHQYVASGRAPKSMELGGLVSALLPSSTAGIKELPAPAPAAPAPTPVERYVNPELKGFRFKGQGRNTNLVRWAIERMTDDYSLRDIALLLDREGAALGSPEISVVLTRLKSRGEIEEIRPGAGPHPALFRQPETATSLATVSEDSAVNPEATAPPAAVL